MLRGPITGEKQLPEKQVFQLLWQMKVHSPLSIASAWLDYSNLIVIGGYTDNNQTATLLYFSLSFFSTWLYFYKQNK